MGRNNRAAPAALVNPPLPPDRVKMISKLLFALRQLCNNEGEERSNLKETVGRKVIRPVMQDLCNQQNHEQKEWLVNAVSLLQSLASNVTNCNLMKDDWKDVKRVLDQSKVSSLD